MNETHGGSPVEIRRLHLGDAHACFENLRYLYEQLSQERGALSLYQLQRALSTASTVVMVARKSNILVGTATICIAPTIGGTLAFIEAVVVDSDHHGHGIGKSLMLRLLERARSEGCTSVQLTCRPSREIAHKLYASLGFKRRETSLLRLML